jgi:hypothetical protein
MRGVCSEPTGSPGEVRSPGGARRRRHDVARRAPRLAEESSLGVGALHRSWANTQVADPHAGGSGMSVLMQRDFVAPG